MVIDPGVGRIFSDGFLNCRTNRRSCVSVHSKQPQIFVLFYQQFETAAISIFLKKKSFCGIFFAAAINCSFLFFFLLKIFHMSINIQL
jgi:hypothetical protein